MTMSRSLVAGLTFFVAVAPAWAAGTVSGRYVGNDKEAKLAHVLVVPHEDWEGEKAYQIIVSEKDPSASERPDIEAMFGKLGDALVLNVTSSGKMFGTQVAHQALEKAGFSTSGTIEVTGFEIENGTISGHFKTDGEREFFGDRWLVDLTVSGKLPSE